MQGRGKHRREDGTNTCRVLSEKPCRRSLVRLELPVLLILTVHSSADHLLCLNSGNEVFDDQSSVTKLHLTCRSNSQGTDLPKLLLPLEISQCQAQLLPPLHLLCSEVCYFCPSRLQLGLELRTSVPKNEIFHPCRGGRPLTLFSFLVLRSTSSLSEVKVSLISRVLSSFFSSCCKISRSRRYNKKKRKKLHSPDILTTHSQPCTPSAR